MMRRFANAGRSLGSGMSELYSNHRGIVSGM